MAFTRHLARLGKILIIVLCLGCGASILWIVFTPSLEIWWKVALLATLTGLCSIGVYIRSMWRQSRTDGSGEVVIPQTLPPKPTRSPTVGFEQEDVSEDRSSKQPHDSDVKYCERLKPVVLICLALLAALLGVASIALSHTASPERAIRTGLLWFNVVLWAYMVVRWYIWSKTYLIISNTRAILATITPFGVMKPNVLLKDCSSQDVRQNILDRWFGTGTLFLNTPVKEDTMWHHLRWARYPDKLEQALGLPTTKQIHDVIKNDKKLRQVAKKDRRRN